MDVGDHGVCLAAVQHEPDGRIWFQAGCIGHGSVPVENNGIASFQDPVGAQAGQLVAAGVQGGPPAAQVAPDSGGQRLRCAKQRLAALEHHGLHGWTQPASSRVQALTLHPQGLGRMPEVQC